MAIEGFVASSHLETSPADPVVTTYPFLISAWGRHGSSGQRTAVRIYNSADFKPWTLAASGHTSSHLVEAREQGSSSSTTCGTGNDTTTWSQMSAWFIATNRREANQNGSMPTVCTASVGSMATGHNSLVVGKWTLSSNTWAWSGTNAALAEISIWDGSGLTVDDRRMLDTLLAAGQNPLVLDVADPAAPWYGKLRAYWPLDNLTTGIQDHSGNGIDLGIVGGNLSVYSSHPEVDGPMFIEANPSAPDAITVTEVTSLTDADVDLYAAASSADLPVSGPVGGATLLEAAWDGTSVESGLSPQQVRFYAAYHTVNNWRSNIASAAAPEAYAGLRLALSHIDELVPAASLKLSGDEQSNGDVLLLNGASLYG
jgi:hypothetical protein